MAWRAVWGKGGRRVERKGGDEHLFLQRCPLEFKEPWPLSLEEFRDIGGGKGKHSGGGRPGEAQSRGGGEQETEKSQGWKLRASTPTSFLWKSRADFRDLDLLCPHLQNGRDNHTPYPIGLLQGFNDTFHFEYLAHRLAPTC